MSELDKAIASSNWLSHIAAKFGDRPPQHYLPLRQDLPCDVQHYQGKYSQQPDFLYFKNMLKMQNYAQRKVLSGNSSNK